MTEEPTEQAEETEGDAPAPEANASEEGAPEEDGADEQPWFVRRWRALLILVLAVVAYGNTLGHGFTLDDQALIVENRRLGEPGYVSYLFLESRWRPVKRLSLIVDHVLWGKQHAGGYHVTNVALHAVTCLLLYGLALQLGVPPVGALLAGALFAVHPVHVEAVANISHRKESLATLFCILATMAWAAARDPDRRARLASRLSGLAGWSETLAARVAVGLLLAGAFLAYVLAVGSKEAAAVMLPVVLLAHVAFLGAGTLGERLRTVAWTAIPIAVVLAVIVLIGNFGDLAGKFSDDSVRYLSLGKADNYGEFVPVVFKAFGWHVATFVAPWPLYLDRAFAVPQSFGELGVLLGLAAMLAWGAALVWTARRAPRAGFGLAWFGIMLLPLLNVVPLTIWLVAERFLYLPSAGACLAVGVAFAAAWSTTTGTSRRALLAGACGTLGVFLVLTIVQNRTWKSDSVLWSHAVRHNEQSFQGWNGIGVAKLAAGEVEEAERCFRHAIELKPNFGEPHYSLARILVQKGHLDEGIEHANTYAEARPSNAAPLMLVGTAHFMARRFDDALEAYLLGMERDATYPNLRVNVGKLLIVLGRHEESLHYLKDPGLPGEDGVERYRMRGMALERLERTEEALDAYALSHQVDPDRYEPLSAAGLLLWNLGRRDEARATIQQSLALNPNQPEFRALIGQQ